MTRHRLPRWVVLAVALVSGASAFCAAQAQPTTPATLSTIAPEVPNPSLVPAPAPDSDVTGTPPLPQPPAPVVPPPPRPRLADYALILPLDSAAYIRAAEAVRDGFLAAAEAAGVKDRVRVLGHVEGQVAGAFAAAEEVNPRVYVGPLLRDDLRDLVKSERVPGTTLALNQLDDGTALPAQMYTLALAVESDARVLVRRMRADNVQAVAIIQGSSPLAQRLAAAFAAEWLLAGGNAPERYRFDPTTTGLGKLREELARSTATAALVAVDGPSAALARSFAPRIPAYASSLINIDHDPSALGDLEGVIFVDMPWLLSPDDASLARLPRKPYGNRVLDRLYAFGLDAFRVARALSAGVPEKLEFDGATGKVLLLTEGRAMVREGSLAQFRRGHVVPADVPR